MFPPGETRKDHEQLISQLYETWQPVGPVEATIVGQIASVVCEIRRFTGETGSGPE